MQNKNFIWYAVGALLGAFVLAAVYWPKAAQEDQRPKPAAIENAPCGSVVVREEITQFSADGPDGLVSVKLDKGIGQLPAGKYHVDSWHLDRKDDQGHMWTLTGRNYGSEGPFEIAEGQRTNVDVGEPIIAAVHGNKIGPKYYAFTQSLQGRLEEQIAMTRNGARPAAPKLRIKNEEGTYDRTFAFQYG
jgi:hypothetical protein